MSHVDTALRQALSALAIKGHIRIKTTPEGMLVALPKKPGKDMSARACLLQEDGKWTVLIRQPGEDRWLESELEEDRGHGIIPMCRYLGLETLWETLGGQ